MIGTPRLPFVKVIFDQAMESANLPNWTTDFLIPRSVCAASIYKSTLLMMTEKLHLAGLDRGGCWLGWLLLPTRQRKFFSIQTFTVVTKIINLTPPAQSPLPLWRWPIVSMIIIDIPPMHYAYGKSNHKDFRPRGAFHASSNDTADRTLVPESYSPPNFGTSIGTHGTGRSSNIPLPSSHVHRTASELQLTRDMEAAERRDVNMFYRLVNGIRERQTSGEGIANIIQTRLANIDDMSHLEPEFETTSFVVTDPRPSLPLIPSIVHVPEECEGGDGWSITGFIPPDDHVATSHHHECDQSCSEDDGVFNMDLWRSGRDRNLVFLLKTIFTQRNDALLQLLCFLFLIYNTNATTTSMLLLRRAKRNIL